MRHTTRLAVLGVTGVLGLGACGGGSDTPTLGQSAQAATTVGPAAGASSTTPTTAEPAATTTTAAPAGTKVSANNASRAELQKAFETAGISNAANWAKEVEQYRPYPSNDPTFAKLRQNLVKYNPAPGVVDQIVATLAL